MLDWLLHGTIAVGDGFCVVGFITWWRAERRTDLPAARPGTPQGATA